MKMPEPVENRRRRGTAKMKPGMMSDMEKMMAAGKMNGLEVTSASINEGMEPRGETTMHLTFRKRGKGKKA